MSTSERLYQILLLLYPPAFRRDYSAWMQQAFRDQRRDGHHQWSVTLVDLLRSAPELRWEEFMKSNWSVATLASYVFCLAAAFFLGRFELHTDDTGVEVFLLLLVTFIFGCWNPKRAWIGAFVALSIPVAELISGGHAPGLHNPRGLFFLACVVTVIGMIGSYSGVFVRKLISH